MVVQGQKMFFCSFSMDANNNLRNLIYRKLQSAMKVQVGAVAICVYHLLCNVFPDYLTAVAVLEDDLNSRCLFFTQNYSLKSAKRKINITCRKLHKFYAFC